MTESDMKSAKWFSLYTGTENWQCEEAWALK